MNDSPPKVFISYSWTSPEHENWVSELATNLRQNGVDVIFDKWDLREGDDSIAFMEKMVSDPEIKKVIMVVDRLYAEKTNERRGGVGTEAQIISAKIYEKQKQNKFVAIVTEKDDEDKLFLPVYYHSRIHIDFTDDEKYSENYEQLIRWIFNKPRHEKPEIGKIPAYITSDNPIQISTSIALRTVLEAIKNHKPIAVGRLNEYLEILEKGLEKFRISFAENKENFEDVFLKNIEEFLPYRNEFIQLIKIICKYSTASHELYAKLLHKFFENIICYVKRPVIIPPHNINGNFEFIIHELFLYMIAIFLKEEKFDYVSYFTETSYYKKDNNSMISYSYMRNLSTSTYSNINPTSLIKTRIHSTDLSLLEIVQADLILALKYCIISDATRWSAWHPVIADDYYKRNYDDELPSLFIKIKSKTYFNYIKMLLNVKEFLVFINNSPYDINKEVYKKIKEEEFTILSINKLHFAYKII